jgi:hypothetical protein
MLSASFAHQGRLSLNSIFEIDNKTFVGKLLKAILHALYQQRIKLVLDVVVNQVTHNCDAQALVRNKLDDILFLVVEDVLVPYVQFLLFARIVCFLYAALLALFCSCLCILHYFLGITDEKLHGLLCAAKVSVLLLDLKKNLVKVLEKFYILQMLFKLNLVTVFGLLGSLKWTLVHCLIVFLITALRRT